MSEQTNRAGKLFVRYWPLVVIATMILLAWRINTWKTKGEKVAPTNQVANAEKSPTQEQICVQTMAEVLTVYESHMAASRFADAAKSLDHCTYHTNSSELIEKRRLALAEVAWAEVHDKASTSEDRLEAFHRLVSLDTDRALKAAKTRETLEAAIEKKKAAERRAEAARKKREGVRLGMTREDVIASSWGRPEHINTTATRYGTREQWVYGIGNYLYFEDGVLTSVQTGGTNR